MAIVPKTLVNKMLSVLLGAVLGIFTFWLVISLVKSDQKIKKTDISAKAIKSLQKGPEERNIWDTITKKPEKISPSDKKKSEFRISQAKDAPKIKETTPWRSNNSIESLSTGTRQEYFYNTGEWIPTIETSISDFLNDPNWAIKHISKEKREIDPHHSGPIAEIALAIKSLETKLDKDLVAKAKEKIINEVIIPFKEDYKKNSQVSNEEEPPKYLPKIDNYLGRPINIANTAYIASILLEDKEEIADILNMAKEMVDYYLSTIEPSKLVAGSKSQWQEELKHIAFLAETFLGVTYKKINLYQNKNVQKLFVLPLVWNEGAQETIVSQIMGARFHLEDSKGEDKKNPETLPEENRLLQVWLEHNALNVKSEEINLSQLTEEIKKESNLPFSSDKDKRYSLILTSPEKHSSGSFLGSYRLLENAWPVGKHIVGDMGLKTKTTLGQPLPIIDGQLQRTVSLNVGHIQELSDNENQLLAEVDITPAYNIEGLKKAQRTILWDKVDNTLHIRDSVTSDRPLKLSTPIITQIDKTPLAVVKGSGNMVASASVTTNAIGEGFRTTTIDLRDPSTTSYIEYSIYQDINKKLQSRNLSISDIIKDNDNAKDKSRSYWFETYLTKKNSERIPLWVRLKSPEDGRGDQNPEYYLDVLIGNKEELLLTTDGHYAQDITLVNGPQEEENPPLNGISGESKNDQKKAPQKISEGKGTPSEKTGVLYESTLISESGKEIPTKCYVHITKPQKLTSISEPGAGYVFRVKHIAPEVKDTEVSLKIWVEPPFEVKGGILTKEYKDIIFSIEGMELNKLEKLNESGSIVVTSYLNEKTNNIGFILKAGETSQNILMEKFNKKKKE